MKKLLEFFFCIPSLFIFLANSQALKAPDFLVTINTENYPNLLKDKLTIDISKKDMKNE